MGGRTIDISVSVAATLALGLLVYLQGVEAATFVIQNKCSFTVWAAGIAVGGGQALTQGQSWSVDVPAGTSAGRFWGRTGCSFDASGKGSCNTGDCGGLLSCQAAGRSPATLAEYTLNGANAAGRSPATLAEYTLNGANGRDTYDISLVDGFNLPLSITPSDSSGPTVDCSSNITASCPTELKVVDGCDSACAALPSIDHLRAGTRCAGAFSNQRLIFKPTLANFQTIPRAKHSFAPFALPEHVHCTPLEHSFLLLKVLMRLEPTLTGYSLRATKEQKHHKQMEHVAEVGAVAAGAFAMYEMHEAKKDPEHAHRHKIEAEIAAAAAVGATGYALYEHHQTKEGHGKKQHHHHHHH